ncbi:Protein kinase [Podosphaera aphanis]|nr:Protein kinase [Podosphaera aphanis]
MATASSATTTPVECSQLHHHRQHHHYLPNTPRSQFARSNCAALQIPQRASSTHRRAPSTHVAAEEALTQSNYEAPNVQQAQKSLSRNRSHSSRVEPSFASAPRQSHSGPHHRRYLSVMTSPPQNGVGSAPPTLDQTPKSGGKTSRSRTMIPAISGNWVLGKTIGAGSMGKVKLARRIEGGEQVAVKIVPRGSIDDGQNQSRSDRERANHSKEVRTAREAAIVTLFDHPYICSMKDVVRTTNHWYMLFEYVNGGQMLDYIISHGRLKEKQARKFSRQIASALDYCHRNSIVHRDLKIENILISKTGDIKIIDFGLSNMFNPRNHLKTFCGSLYFAAPELLQAKQYIGPEVDVWSFGIVLYVLVCGKVPFDDQSMPALHAKIKKGLVEYPSWLSPDCKNIISRMLVTDPRQRASLQEIMCHTWMMKGYGSMPENYLPIREPLQLPLDQGVIQAMTGFDFGPPETIQTQLTEVLESQEYIKAVKISAQEREAQAPLRDPEKKRSFGFDFYKRRSYSNSRDTLAVPSSEGLSSAGCDPINAFHPLISVYHLVREKQERDRLAAKCLLRCTSHTPNETPLKLTEISAPKSAHTNSAAYELPGEKATGGRSRPRARTHGEEEVTETIKNLKFPKTPGVKSPTIVEPSPGYTRKESTAAGILRRFSTRRRKDTSDRSLPPPVSAHTPHEAKTLRKSFSVRRPRDRESDRSPSPNVPTRSLRPHNNSPFSAPRSKNNSIRGFRGLTRSSSVNSAEYRSRESERKNASSTNWSEHSIPRNSYSHGSVKEGYPTQRIASRAQSLGHARRESIQARRVKIHANTSEDNDADVGDTSSLSNERIDNAENVKPVFLKGLFSVSTTSTKSVAFIRADIIRVLNQHGVEYKEIRGGFSCRHMPSIDLKKVHDLPPSAHNNSVGHRRKISFGGFMGGNLDRDRDEFRDAQISPQTPRTPARQRKGTSFTNSDTSDNSSNKDDHGSSARAAGETSTHVKSDLGGSMILEFEILIVKVSLLLLHGIQFKRLAGGTWQYKNMADQILRELKL